MRGDIADLADIDALYDAVRGEVGAIDALFGRESFRTSASGSRELAARRANGRRAS
ncbi:MAG TPA: hypothetical protein VF495_00085 [Phenylobacterium sp.]